MNKRFNIKKNSIRETCLEAESLFSLWKIHKDDSNDMVLAIEESLTNIFEHGYCTSADSCCIVNIEIFEGVEKVYIVISDSAKEFSLESCKSVDPATYIKSDTIGGFGVTIIKKTMNEVALFPLFNENVLIMGKNVRYEKTGSFNESEIIKDQPVQINNEIIAS